MFSKAKPKSYKTAASIAPSILSTDLAITGDLVSEGELQIDGKVNGDVRCTMLTIGVTGCLTGQVFADYALIRGKVDGRIRAHNVTLARTARVTCWSSFGPARSGGSPDDIGASPASLSSGPLSDS